MTDCERTADLLMDYINRRLTQQESSEIIIHLATCPSCRKETAKLIKVKDLEQNSMIDIPDDILQSAFDKLPPNGSILDAILQSDSCFMAFDLIKYSILTAQQTIQLAKQAM